jgi:serine/threonine-protein kinase
MQDVLTEQPDPPSSIAQVPAPVDELIMPALEKSKSDRYDSTVYLRDGLKQLYQSPENVGSGISKPIFHDQQPEHASETAEIGVETNEIGTQGDPRSSENDSSRRHLIKYLGFLGIITGGTGLGAWGAFADFSTTSSKESTDGDDTYVGSNEQVVDSGNDANNNDETTDNAEHTASRDSEPTVESSQSDDVTVVSSTRERMVENVPEEINNYLNDGDATFYRGTIADYTGQDEVTIYVGMIDVFGFQPPALRVDAGTTVVWEWTGEGGSHNIVSEPSSTIQFNSGDPVNEAGHTFEMTFNEPNIHLYYCTAHRVDGEIGAIDVV